MAEANVPATDRLWTKDFLLIILANFFMIFVQYTLLTLLPVYVLDLGGTETQAGLMTGVFTLVALALRPFIGVMLDTRSRKMVLLLGYSIIFLSVLSIAYTDSIIGILAIRVLYGVGFSAASTAGGTIAADILTNGRLAEGIGYYGMSNSVAQSVSAFTGLAIIKYAGYHALFIFLFLVMTAAIACGLGVRCKKVIVKGGEKKEEAEEKGIFMFLEASTIPPAIMIIFLASANSATVTFLVKYAFSRGVDDIGLFFVLFAIIAMSTRLVMGKIARRFGFAFILLTGAACLLLSQVIILFSTNLYHFMAAAVFYGLAQGFYLPILNTIIVLLASPEKKGKATATYYSALDVAMGFGAIFFGLVAQLIGFTAVYLISSVNCLIAIAFYHFMLRTILMDKDYH